MSATGMAAASPSALDIRIHVLNHLGVEPAFRDELIRRNHLDFSIDPSRSYAFPLTDEPFVPAWEEYAAAVRQSNSLETLGRYLVQLRFPVCEGMSEDPSYIRVTRQGAPADLFAPASHSSWTAPDQGMVFLRATAAGHLASIFAANRADFVYLVRALSRRNEPVHVPESMGACVVGGYNNWNRIGAHRDRFVFQHGTEAWKAELQKIRTVNKHLFQDSFLILSGGPYSGVPASQMGMPETEWLQKSLQIRHAHETAHYFTRRVLSSARNHVGDEVIADFFALTRVFPVFDGVTFLQCFGLEAFPAYREGGRLENYRGAPPLTDGAFQALQRLLLLVAENFEEVDRALRAELRLPRNEAPMLLALCQFTVEEMAASGFAARYQSAFHQWRKACQQAKHLPAKGQNTNNRSNQL